MLNWILNSLVVLVFYIKKSELKQTLKFYSYSGSSHKKLSSGSATLVWHLLYSWQVQKFFLLQCRVYIQYIYSIYTSRWVLTKGGGRNLPYKLSISICTVKKFEKIEISVNICWWGGVIYRWNINDIYYFHSLKFQCLPNIFFECVSSYIKN